MHREDAVFLLGLQNSLVLDSTIAGCWGRQKGEREKSEGILLAFNSCFLGYFGSLYLT